MDNEYDGQAGYSGKRPILSSWHNPRIKRVLRLRKSSERRRSGRFLIDGWREIELAARCGISIEIVFFTGPQILAGNRLSERCTLQPVSIAVLNRISYGQRSDSPVAVAITPDFPLSRIKPKQDCLWLVLDRTEKPGNLGACLRTASAAGVDTVILTDPICEVFNPNTIRASRGAVFTLSLAVCRPSEFLEFCQSNAVRLWSSRVDATRRLWDCDFKKSTAIVFGNEAEGLGGDWHRLDSFTIPMQGLVDSLNLSISTAVTLYEAVRQRGVLQE